MISFLYQTATSQPDLVKLIAEGGYSNPFLFHLLLVAQVSYERVGFIYLHSLILALVLVLVNNPKIAQATSEPCSRALDSEYKVQGSYADLVLNIVLNICDSEPFWPSFGCIFHVIAPYVSSVTRQTAARVLELFESVMEKQKALVPLFIEAFASVVQRQENADNGFVVAIMQKHAIFKKLDGEDPKLAKALSIVRAYLRLAARAIKNTKKSQLLPPEMAEILAKVHLDGSEQVQFAKHTHVFGGEIEHTWGEWALMLFARAFREEMRRLQALQAEYDATLFAKL